MTTERRGSSDLNVPGLWDVVRQHRMGADPCRVPEILDVDPAASNPNNSELPERSRRVHEIP